MVLFSYCMYVSDPHSSQTNLLQNNREDNLLSQRHSLICYFYQVMIVELDASIADECLVTYDTVGSYLEVRCTG